MTVINLLMDYLKDNGKVMNIKFKQAVIKNESIYHYELSEDTLFILTTNNNEYWFDISNFNRIKFDAIVWNAETIFQMNNCLKALEKETHFNAYLLANDDQYMVEFVSVRDRK